MKNAIILHGMPDKAEYFDKNEQSPSNAHWIPWLQAELNRSGILTQTPEMSKPYAPNYEEWKKVFEQFKVNTDTKLIGHSCGGGFFVRWLSENKMEIDQLVLVAPWLDPDRINTTDFFKFKIDPNLPSRIAKIDMFISSDDAKDILESVDIVKTQIKGINMHKFEDKGHFTEGDMGTNEFVELLNTINLKS